MAEEDAAFVLKLAARPLLFSLQFFQMRLLSRPAFYVIVLLIAMMVALTLWLQWKLDTLPRHKAKQESPPAAVSDRP